MKHYVIGALNRFPLMDWRVSWLDPGEEGVIESHPSPLSLPITFHSLSPQSSHHDTPLPCRFLSPLTRYRHNHPITTPLSTVASYHLSLAIAAIIPSRQPSPLSLPITSHSLSPQSSHHDTLFISTFTLFLHIPYLYIRPIQIMALSSHSMPFNISQYKRNELSLTNYCYLWYYRAGYLIISYKSCTVSHYILFSCFQFCSSGSQFPSPPGLWVSAPDVSQPFRE